jgi:hypothetical protein
MDTLGQQQAPAAAAGGLLGGSALGAAALTGARRPSAGMVAGVVSLTVAGVAVRRGSGVTQVSFARRHRPCRI